MTAAFSLIPLKPAHQGLFEYFYYNCVFKNFIPLIYNQYIKNKPTNIIGGEKFKAKAFIGSREADSN